MLMFSVRRNPSSSRLYTFEGLPELTPGGAHYMNDRLFFFSAFPVIIGPLAERDSPHPLALAAVFCALSAKVLLDTSRLLSSLSRVFPPLPIFGVFPGKGVLLRALPMFERSWFAGASASLMRNILFVLRNYVVRFFLLGSVCFP